MNRQEKRIPFDKQMDMETIASLFLVMAVLAFIILMINIMNGQYESYDVVLLLLIGIGVYGFPFIVIFEEKIYLNFQKMKIFLNRCTKWP